MTELEQLQQQIEKLEKTVDELRSGTIKVISLKDRLSREQCAIFNKYFESTFDMKDEYWNRGDFVKPGYVIAHETRDKCRIAVRDACKALFIMNHYLEFSDISSYARIEKLIKTEKEVQEYLGYFEDICKMISEKCINKKFKV